MCQHLHQHEEAGHAAEELLERQQPPSRARSLHPALAVGRRVGRAGGGGGGGRDEDIEAAAESGD